mgnify:CR=1 FL=1
MKTAEEIIAYLEVELAEAWEMVDECKDKQERLLHLARAATITEVLVEIKR